MGSLTRNIYLMLLVIVVLLCLCASSVSAALKDGYFAKKLDEYFSTLKCMANIMEDFLSEYNLLLACCGVWILHGWLGGLVLDNCYDHNYHQLNNLTEPFLQQMDETCYDYPRDSFSCKLLLITPITIVVTIILLILGLTICAILTCIRLKRYQRYYENQKGLGFSSVHTDETSDESSAEVKTKKSFV